jgi:16S rRNA G966 N2-methylase RsmD
MDLKKYLIEFESLTEDLPLRYGGISRSEAFAFVSLCKMFDVDLVIDSGTGKGISAEYFARNFEHIYTIDNHQHYNDSKQISSEALSKYKNVTYIVGDAYTEIPKILKKGKRCAVFFDGPKSKNALKFSKTLNLSVMGFHDVLPKSEDFNLFKKEKGFLFHTHSSFFEEFNILNQNRLKIKDYPNGPGAAFLKG